MKTTNLLTLAALIGTCSFASAADKPKHPDGPGPGHEVPPEVLKKFDTNGDGKLDETERKAMYEDMKAEMLKKFDKDGDGKLSEDERKAMRADMEAHRKELLEKYDANKNGKFDPEEIQAARAAGEKMPPMFGHGPGGPDGPGGHGKPEGHAKPEGHGRPDGKGPDGPPPAN